MPTKAYGQWKIGVNGTSKRPWFVFRTRDCGIAPIQVLCDRRGHYRRFGREATARKAADDANKGALEYVA